ncbi:MAG: hypothetical protein HQK53_19455, partial [Oligoflexia bacterium]|nr:hypothetical protein [Oligoflexia bacterium]
LVGSSILANYYVQENLGILAGHFPGRPILPGVVQIEMMAQAACFGIMPILMIKEGKSSWLNTKFEVALAKVEVAKFRKPILPGAHLKIFSLCTKVRGRVHCYDCHIKNGADGEIFSETSLMAHHNIWA